jgi:hypothetical protein
MTTLKLAGKTYLIDGLTLWSPQIEYGELPKNIRDTHYVLFQRSFTKDVGVACALPGSQIFINLVDNDWQTKYTQTINFQLGRCVYLDHIDGAELARIHSFIIAYYVREMV